MVAVAFGVQFLAGGFYQLGFSVYFLPLSRDLGLSRTALSLIFSLRSFEGGLDGPLVGYLVDHFSYAPVYLLVGAMGPLGAVLFFVIMRRIERVPAVVG